MTTLRCNDNWVQFNSHENQIFEEEEEGEALSLCDLPTNDHQIETNSNREDNDSGDFEFGSGHGATTCRSPENMCTAEEVFFQGRILPLSHSVTSVNVVNGRSNENDPKKIRSNGYGYMEKPKIRNQFHSHPSPSPQIRTQSFRTFSHSNPKASSSLWSFLQVGLVKPQEIGLSDLKNRSKRFGSHNSNSSSNSSSMNSTNDQNPNPNSNPNLTQYKNKMRHPRKNTKKKQRLFFGGCKCSAVTTDGAIKEGVAKKKTTKEESMLHLRNLQVSEESTMIGEGKQTASRHRTFEWLKQLSLAAPSEA